MINFVNILYENSFQEREEKANEIFANQLCTPNRPIDFQYKSSEVVSSCVAKKINNLGQVIETITLDTSLINVSSGYHICSGNIDFATPLECGMYYFLVNGKYQSETFQVININEVLTGLEESIYLSGLYFYDIENDEPEDLKQGKPFISFGREYSTNTYPLKFEYKSSESVSSFYIVELNILGQVINTTVLDTSLITSNGNTHLCTGESLFNEPIREGIYYFVVNEKYYSKIFHIFELVCPSIEIVSITNAIEGETATINYTGQMIGSATATSTEITFRFSSGLSEIVENRTLNNVVQNFSVNFAIPYGIYGNIYLYISNNICVNIKNTSFEITETPCFELLESGVLELFEGECLEFME